MKPYTVVFLDEAEAEMFESYEWGRSKWGEEAAENWIRRLNERIYGQLARFPESCPIAPESAYLEVEVRQLIIQRYRVLFEIDGRTVVVHHLQGSYSDRDGSSGTDDVESDDQ